MYKFEYHRAISLSDAVAWLGREPDAKLLAGGMSLIPLLKLRMAQASHLIDMCDIEGLCDISEQNGQILIGAMASHASVGASPLVRQTIPALAELASGIGDPHCRNRGTLGGSISHADPSACYPSAVLSLGATVVTNLREIPAEEFFQGPFSTAIEPGEIVVAVKFPIPEQAAYIKFPQPASRFSIVGVFVSRRQNQVRIAVTGSAGAVFRVPDFEKALADNFVPSALAGLAVNPNELSADSFATTGYRAKLIGVLAQRGVSACLARKGMDPLPLDFGDFKAIN